MYLLTAPDRISRQERLLADIKYVKGTDNVVVDTLSKRGYVAATQVSSLLSSALMQEIASTCATDPTVL